jgi:putative transposase
MQRVAMRYSRYRHQALKTTGHLFERRYKAKFVHGDPYFLTVLRYIHLNPVSAHIVSEPHQYPWSSHRAYLGTESVPWLTTELGLSMFSSDLRRARAAYEHFIRTSGEVDETVDNESCPQDSLILSTDSLASRIPAAFFRPRNATTLEDLAAAVCGQQHVSVTLVRSRSSAHALTPVRLQIAREAIDQRVATLTQVAHFLDRDPSTLCKLLSKYPRKLQ